MNSQGLSAPKRIVEDYLRLPYTIEVYRDDDEENPGWVARVVELPGCLTQGDTFEELGEMIEDAMRIWIETALEDGEDIPEPRPVENYSGKFIVRVPRSLHRELVGASVRDNASLNLFVSTALGKAVGHTSREKVRLEEVSPIDLPQAISWPRLSEKARRLLIAYGFSSEAQEVDERLFATWVDAYLDQARTALELAEYKQALDYVRPLRLGMEQLCDQSPIIRTYCQAMFILEELITVTYHLHSGMVEQDQIKKRVLSQIRNSSRIVMPSLEELTPNEGLFQPDLIGKYRYPNE